MAEPTGDIAIVTAETIREKMYVVRGQRVMLDFDLAEIYGYTTGRFNQQVKRNIEKFTGDDFMFRLTEAEVESVRSQNVTSRVMSLFSGQSGGARYLPRAFTEQGIYMLMTVLRGELATKQSIALIRLFKQMKDCIAEARVFSGWHDVMALAAQTSENARAIGELREGLSETQETLAEFMAEFDAPPFGREYLILDGQAFEADVAYQQIYGLARETVFVIDNYIGAKTLLHLRHVASSVCVTVFSDNVGKGLTMAELVDFRKEYPDVAIELRRTGGRFHDRFIVLDCGLEDERVFVCGASSKDAGRRVTTIIESSSPEMYRGLVDGLTGSDLLELK